MEVFTVCEFANKSSFTINKLSTQTNILLLSHRIISPLKSGTEGQGYSLNEYLGSVDYFYLLVSALNTVDYFLKEKSAAVRSGSLRPERRLSD